MLTYLCYQLSVTTDSFVFISMLYVNEITSFCDFAIDDKSTFRLTTVRHMPKSEAGTRNCL